MEPAKRTDTENEFLDLFSMKLFGVKRSEAIRANFCVDCGGMADEFTDDLSRKEFSISGLCEDCQNSFFKGVDEVKDEQR